MLLAVLHNKTPFLFANPIPLSHYRRCVLSQAKQGISTLSQNESLPTWQHSEQLLVRVRAIPSPNRREVQQERKVSPPAPSWLSPACAEQGGPPGLQLSRSGAWQLNPCSACHEAALPRSHYSSSCNKYLPLHKYFFFP